MSRKRTLSPEDRALWEQVARTAKPLHPERADPVPHPPPKPPKPLAPKPAPPAPAFRVGEKVDHHGTHDLLPSLAQQMAKNPVQMDRKTHTRMMRGKMAPEARIDLHGMTLAEAHPELIHFVMTSHARGLRLILVITGKGKDRDDGGPIPTRFGVLRHQVPQWLRMPPLAPLILQISPASRNYGGTGAYFIYLRR